MRLTIVLCRSRRKPVHKLIEVRQLKKLWNRHGNYVVRLDPIPTALQGKELVEATDLVSPSEKKWVPPPGDFRFLQPPKPNEEMPDYHTEPILEMNERIRLAEGMRQACILAKCQHIIGLPDQVKQLIGQVTVPDQDELVQKAIMRSQLWNNLHEKLPKRKDLENLKHVFRREFGVPRVKQGELLLTDLVTLSQKIAMQTSKSAFNRRLINLPSLQSHYVYKDKTVSIQNIGHSVVMQQNGLPPFASNDMVEESANQSLPDMFPIFPTIDLRQTNNYSIRSQAVWKEEPDVYSRGLPHTLYLNNTQLWKNDQQQAAALMLCLGYAVTIARAKYGADVKKLPEPVTIQNVNMTWNTANYLFLQLNTMDFTSDEGVKNIVWTDSDNMLFDRKLPQPWKGMEAEFRKVSYHSYQKEFFDKFLAVHLYGLNDIKYS